MEVKREKVGVVSRVISKENKTVSVIFLIKVTDENNDESYIESEPEIFDIDNDILDDIRDGWEYGNIVKGYDLMTKDEVEEEIEEEIEEMQKPKSNDRGR